MTYEEAEAEQWLKENREWNDDEDARWVRFHRSVNRIFGVILFVLFYIGLVMSYTDFQYWDVRAALICLAVIVSTPLVVRLILLLGWMVMTFVLECVAPLFCAIFSWLSGR